MALLLLCQNRKKCLHQLRRSSQWRGGVPPEAPNEAANEVEESPNEEPKPEPGAKDTEN